MLVAKLLRSLFTGRPPGRQQRRRGATLLLLALAGPPAAAEPNPIIALEVDDQTVLLHRPAVDGLRPAVIILPDAVQRDMRHERYAEDLLAAGIAVVVPLTEAPALDWLIDRLREEPGLDLTRLGVLALGAGGAQAMAIERPAALL